MKMNKKIVSFALALGLVLSLPLSAEEAAPALKKQAPPAVSFDIEQSVIKQPLAEGVSADDAMDAMHSKAVELNIKIVAHQPLSAELEARGIEDVMRLEILQFCNPEDAYELVKFNPIFAAYMPCRIALAEDQDGQLWVMMMNLDMLINNTPLPPELREIAVNVNNTLKAIMEAAAAGEF